MYFRGLQAILTAQYNVDNTQEFIFFNRGDALPQKHGFNLRVLMKVTNFRDSAHRPMKVAGRLRLRQYLAKLSMKEFAAV